jgi:hypothetical protein
LFCGSLAAQEASANKEDQHRCEPEPSACRLA